MIRNDPRDAQDDAAAAVGVSDPVADYDHPIAVILDCALRNAESIEREG